jgi:hypothetical protein
MVAIMKVELRGVVSKPRELLKVLDQKTVGVVYLLNPSIFMHDLSHHPSLLFRKGGNGWSNGFGAISVAPWSTPKTSFISVPDANLHLGENNFHVVIFAREFKSIRLCPFKRRTTKPTYA